MADSDIPVEAPSEDVHRRPPWVEPPVDVVPGIVPVELILARTPQRAIGLTGMRAYPTGFGCTLHLRLREDIPGEQSNFGAFNMFGDGVDPAGEIAHRSRGEDVDDTDLRRVEPFAHAGDHGRGEHGIPTDREEVVGHAEASLAGA